MDKAVFKFQSHTNPIAKIIGILLIINLLAILYLAISPLFPAYVLPLNFDPDNVITTFIVLIVAQFSLIRNRDTLNILNDGRIQVEYSGKKKQVVGFTKESFPRFFLLISRGLFVDKITVVLNKQDRKFQTIVTLDIPKDDAAAVTALSVALQTFGFQEMDASDTELIEFVKHGFTNK